MASHHFPSPLSEMACQQHEVADTRRTEALLQAIPDRPEVLQAMRCKHVVSMRHFDAEVMLQLFRSAASFELGLAKPDSPMVCKILGGCFLDPDRPDVELAFRRSWQSQGGSYLDLSPAINNQLANKRHVSEIAATINNYCNLVVINTTDEALFADILGHSQVPIINAGNGEDEAPTQALADIYTLLKWRPDLLEAGADAEKRLRVGIFGSPSNTGTLRSLLLGLGKMPGMVAEIILLDRVDNPFDEGQREELQEAGIKISLIAELYPNDTVMGGHSKVVPQLDVIYSHLKQQQQYISRLDMLDFKNLFKPNLLLMSPQRQLPKFGELINDSPHNGFFAQARSGVYVIMALLDAIME